MSRIGTIGRTLQVPEGGFSLSWLQRVVAEPLQRIVATVQELVKSPTAETFLRVEERFFKLVAQVGSCVMGGLLAWLHEDEEWIRQCREDSRGRADVNLRSQGWRWTSVQLLGGVKLRLRSPYLSPDHRGKRGPRRGVGKRGPGGSGHYPALEALGINDRVSPAVASEVAKQLVRASSGSEAQQALAERGLELDVKTVFRLAGDVAEEALAQRQARVEAAAQGLRFSDEFAGKRIVISADGGRVRLREGGRRGRRRQSGRRGFRTPWREPKLVTAYVIDDEGCKVRTELPLYDGTLGDADATFELLLAELKLRGADQADTLVVVADGARWIWDRADELVEALGLQKDQVVKVADFYHAVQHLKAIAELRSSWSDTEKENWFRRMRRRLKESVTDVVEAARELCRGRRAKQIKTHVAYFEDRAEQMRYQDFASQGIPLGSGAMESTVRRVVNLRFKGASIFWREENLEGLLHLRAYYKAGRWDELMRRVIHRSPHGRPVTAPSKREP